MKSQSFVFCNAVCGLLVGSLVYGTMSQADTSKKNDSQATLFASYSKSEAFDAVVQSHLNAKWHREQKIIFHATWFSDGRDRVAMQCLVNEKGKVSGYRDVYDWAQQAGFNAQLSAEKRQALNTALLRLPSSQLSPLLKQLLIVSFLRGGKWTTRTYDKSKLPDAVSQIYALTAAPLK